MEMRLRAPVHRGYFFLLGASRLVNAASLRNIDQKKISSGTQGNTGTYCICKQFLLPRGPLTQYRMRVRKMLTVKLTKASYFSLKNKYLETKKILQQK